MSEVLLVLAVAATAFLSTSLDNLVLLIGLMSGNGMRARHALIGYGGAVAAAVVLALVAARAADLLADAWLRYLGFVPLGLGGWRLLQLRRAASAPRPEARLAHQAGPLPLFGVMLANSGDSIGVFGSLLAETAGPLVAIVAATPLAMSVLWVAVARFVVRRPALAPALRAVERYAIAPLLIAVGLYILADTPTDVE